MLQCHMASLEEAIDVTNASNPSSLSSHQSVSGSQIFS